MNDMAIESLKNAVRRNPANAYYWTNLGLCFRRKFELSDGYEAARLTKADRCYDAAVSFRPQNIETLMKAGRYWVWRSNLLPGGNEAGINRFQHLFRRILAIEPERWKEAAETVATYYPDGRILIGIVAKGADEVAERLLAWVVTQGAEQKQ